MRGKLYVCVAAIFRLKDVAFTASKIINNAQ